MPVPEAILVVTNPFTAIVWPVNTRIQIPDGQGLIPVDPNTGLIVQMIPANPQLGRRLIVQNPIGEASVWRYLGAAMGAQSWYVAEAWVGLDTQLLADPAVLRADLSSEFFDGTPPGPPGYFTALLSRLPYLERDSDNTPVAFVPPHQISGQNPFGVAGFEPAEGETYTIIDNRNATYLARFGPLSFPV